MPSEWDWARKRSLDWGNPLTYIILDWKIHNASRELKHSNTTPKAEFGIVLTQVRSYVFSIQYSVSHRIGNPVWIYNRTDHFFHTTISSHYVLVNTIWLLLLYSHTGLSVRPMILKTCILSLKIPKWNCTSFFVK